ncbi:unnamed protein product [Arctogadus glacialis]
MKMSPKQSLPTTSRASGGQANGAGAGPKKTTSPNTSCEFYNTYTNVYAPVVIDSSSSDVEEVDYSQVEDREDCKYLSFDSKAADGDEYFHVGRMVAMSIVHGGPGPRCFSENFYHYLVGKEKTIEAPIADVPDPELRNVLLEIKNATTLEELLELADKPSSMLQTAGCYRCLRTLEDKEQVVNDYIQWFKDGLATLNLFNAVEQHPSLFLPYLVYSAEDLKAETLEALFRPQMSPTGSSNRQE